MTTVLTALPRPPQRAEPSAAAADTGGGVPLAPHPGPLPFSPARQQRPRRRSALARTALALASLLIFAGGMVGGFALSRWTAGVPVVPTLAQRSAISTPAPTIDPDGLRVQEVAITNDRPGTTEGVVTRFAIGVPAGWVAYRPPLSSADTPLLAMFVSPEGNRAISVDHLRDFYPRGTIKNYLTRTQADLAKAVDEVVAQPVNPVGPPAAGSPEGPFETSFRTVQRGTAGEVLRTTLVRLQPAGADLWVIKVTVPSDQQKAADALYTDVVASFRPIGI